MSRSKTRKFSFQSLENRELMAGDVAVVYDSDSKDLLITGDDQDNQIEIVEVAEDRVRIRGLEGTTVNGNTYYGLRYRALFGRAPTETTRTLRDDLTINMRGGDDEVIIKDLIMNNYGHSDLKVELGDGDDTLELISTDVARHARIYGGNGNDEISITDTVMEDLLIEAGTVEDQGRDRDNVKITGNGRGSLFSRAAARAEDMTLRGGSGLFTVELSGDTVVQQRLVVEAGEGGLHATINPSIAKSVEIEGSDVADTIKIDGMFTDVDIKSFGGTDFVQANGQVWGDMRIDSGSGRDRVYIGATGSWPYWGSELTVDLGAGNDYLSLVNSHDWTRVSFDGGSGYDEYYEADNGIFMIWMAMHNFENHLWIPRLY